MKALQKIACCLLTLAMLLSMAACGTGGTNGESSNSPKPSAEAGANASGEKTTLRLLTWGATEDEAIAKRAVARFNESYPDVNVEITILPVVDWSDFITKWSTMITSGEAPDVISYAVEAFPMAVDNELLLPLDDIVAEDDALSLDGYPEALLDGFSRDEKTYGIPSGTQTMVMYYNKDMLKEAGLDAPTDGWTWDEFYDYAKALTKDGVYGFGLANSYFQLFPWFSTNGTSPTTADLSAPAMTSPEFLESVEFMNKLVEEKVTPDPISSDVYTMFANREIAMVGAGRWCLDTWKDAGLNNDNFDCVQWPVSGTDTSSSASVFGGAAYGISATTKNKDLAVALLAALTSEETQIDTASSGQQIPPTSNLANDPEIMGTTPDNIGGLWVAIENSVAVACPSFYGDLSVALLGALESIWSGAATVEDALAQAQTQVEDAIR